MGKGKVGAMTLILPDQQEQESTTDATDLATAITLVNALKDTLNELIIKYNELLSTIRNNKGGF